VAEAYWRNTKVNFSRFVKSYNDTIQEIQYSYQILIESYLCWTQSDQKLLIRSEPIR